MHVLNNRTVDPDICNPSSPLYMIGYMDTKGSNNDDNGSNKHLFL